VRLFQFRLGKSRLRYVKTGEFRLSQVMTCLRLFQVRTGYIRLVQLISGSARYQVLSGYVRLLQDRLG